MANQFTIDPMGDLTGPMQGLTQSIQSVGIARKEEAVKAKAEARFNEVQTAYKEASAAGDMNAIADLSFKYPEFGKAILLSMGIKNEAAAKEATDFALSVVSAPPEDRPALYKRRVSSLQQGGRGTEESAESYMRYASNPEGEVQKMEDFLAYTNPAGWKALQESRKVEEASKRDTKVVDGVLVDTQTGDIVFEKIEIPKELDATEKAKLKKLNLENEKLEKALKEGPKKGKASARQDLAAGYHSRMTTAQTEIDRILRDNPNFDPASAAEKAAAVSNVTTTKEMQQYKQAAGDWIRSKLRWESGAVISKDEEAAEFRTYFPQFGDKASTIELKKRARKVAERAMGQAAGNALVESVEAAQLPPGLPEGTRDNGDGSYTLPDGRKVTRNG